jgi:hypothetical protein
MRIHPLAAAVLLACAAAPAAAQPAVLRPGRAGISAEGLVARVETFEVYVADGDGSPLGTMTLRTRMGTSDGTESIIRTETTLIDGELAQVDSFWLDRRTLAPLGFHSSTEEHTMTLAFTPGAVRSVYDADWGADTADVPLPEPVFLAPATDLLLSALPLAAGYTARLAVYDQEAGIGTMAVEVEGADEFPAGGGRRVAAWRVRVTEAGSAGTYWMDRESHAMVQFQSEDGGVRIVRAPASRSRARTTR